MLSRLFQQLFASVGVVYRTIRAFFVRALSGVVARVRSATSLTRQAARVAPAMVRAAATAGKKPTRREDYIETKQLFVSKSFLLLAGLATVAVLALLLLVVRPWLVSRFFTARMWEQDKAVADYTGKVLLCHDKQEELPSFRGRLEEGLPQGRGTAYDELGRTVYSGDYADGLYHGTGKLYEGGMLVYEGGFAEGRPEGHGVAYGPGERPVYEGDFVRGVRSGTGTVWQDGQRLYQGDFANDRYHGPGKLYDGEGLLYEGGFAEGLYDGAGRLSLSGGVTVEAQFRAGVPDGAVRWLVDGRLLYEGELAQWLPEGAGTLYSPEGKAVYSGPVRNGAVDGAALLGSSADHLRSLLDSRGVERAEELGFAISDGQLGLTAFCAYADGEREPMVYGLYLYPPSGEQQGLWHWPEDFDWALSDDETTPGPATEDNRRPDLLTELPVSLGERPHCRSYHYEGMSLRLWSVDGQSPPLLWEWRLEQSLTRPQTTPDEGTGAAGRLDALLARLGLGEGSSAGPAGANPYVGSKAISGLLSAVAPAQRTEAALAALRYLERAEARVADEDSLALCRSLVEQEKTLLAQGLGDEARLTGLEEQAARLEVDIMGHVVQMRKDARTLSERSGGEVEDFDPAGLAVLFELSKLDGAALCREAVELAMERALAQAAPPPEEGGEPVVEPVDTAAVSARIEDGLMELELAHRGVELALRAYEGAERQREKLSRDAAMGLVAPGVQEEQQMSCNRLRADLYAAMAAFGSRVAELNEQTGGLLAVQAGWLPQVMGQIQEAGGVG